jgi:hypothetical protein
MDDEGTEARLSVLEFLMEGLWAQTLASLSPENSKGIVESLRAASQRWALTPGNPPQDVTEIQATHAIQAEWAAHLIDRIVATEQLLRRRQPSTQSQRESDP